METNIKIIKKNLHKKDAAEKEKLIELYRGEFDDCDNSPYSTQCTC